MAALAFNAIDKTGVELSSLLVAASSGGDTFPTGSQGIIVINNADDSPHTVTITTPVATKDCPPFGNQTISNIDVVVPAGEQHIFTVPSGYATSGLISLTYDAVTSVTVGGIIATPV